MSITIAGVSIAKNPVYPLDWYQRRFNQATQDTSDGGRATYDGGPTVIYGTIVIRTVAKAEGDSLRTALSGAAVRFQESSFTVTPQAAGNTNLGKGDGTAIRVFYNGGASLQGVFALVAPGLYDIALPYREDLNGIP